MRQPITFLSATLDGLIISGQMLVNNTEITDEGARAEILRGVTSGPEFLSSTGWLKSNPAWYLTTLAQQIGLNDENIKTSIRTWDPCVSTPEVNDQIILAHFDRDRDRFVFRYLLIAKSTFVRRG